MAVSGLCSWVSSHYQDFLPRPRTRQVPHEGNQAQYTTHRPRGRKAATDAESLSQVLVPFWDGFPMVVINLLLSELGVGLHMYVPSTTPGNRL